MALVEAGIDWERGSSPGGLTSRSLNQLTKGPIVRYSEIEPTAEMLLWTGDEEPRLAPVVWGTYTSLGPFVPNHSKPVTVVYASRVAHSGRHQVRARWGQLRRWAASAWREVGEFLIGAFQPIRDAV